MELAGDVAIGVPPPQVWAALNDVDVLRQCIPGCEEVQKISDTETHTRVLLKMGPVRARFVGKILMSEVRPDAGCTLNFEGSGGAAGFARGSSVVNLVADGAGTRLHYNATASIGGKLGQIGGRMIDASAKQMADQFFNAFRNCVDGSTTTASPSASTSDSASGSASNSASGSASAGMSGVGSVPVVPAGAPAFAPSYASAGTVGRGVAQPAATGLNAEYVRVLWFALGAGATGFGVWLAGHFAR